MSTSMTLRDIRPFVGSEVTVRTLAGSVRARMLSCTSRSVWLVSGDDDVVLDLTQVLGITH
jgi:hypothetical protein